MTFKREVTYDEVSLILRNAISGTLVLDKIPGINWWHVNEPFIYFGKWEIQFFIEANWIYDIYEVYSPDGRISEFHPAGKNSDIKNFLHDYEVAKLCKLLGCP